MHFLKAAVNGRFVCKICEIKYDRSVIYMQAHESTYSHYHTHTHLHFRKHFVS